MIDTELHEKLRAEFNPDGSDLRKKTNISEENSIIAKLRTTKLKKNILGSVSIKCSILLIEILKVPILLSYLSNDKYGIWLTVVSLVLWTQHFDLGLSSGLRFKITEALANQNHNRVKQLISTAYISLALIMAVVLLLILPIISVCNWQSILNTECVMNRELVITISILLAVFVMQFVLELISAVLKADQRVAISDIFKPIGSVISLLAVFVMGFYSHDSLLYASLAMSIPYVVVLFAANIYFFAKSYRRYAPAIRTYNKQLLKEIYSLGVKFFTNQLSSLVVFTTANILLSNLVNPAEVATYNTARTYYGLILVFYTVVVTAANAPITDAFVRGDMAWVKRCVDKLMIAGTLGVVVEFIMLALSSVAFDIWVGDRIIVPIGLSLFFVSYNAIALFGSQYTYFLGAVGKLNLNMIISIVKIVTFIPTAIISIKWLGAKGLVLATIVINTLPNLIFGRIQYKKLISGTATGIWNR